MKPKYLVAIVTAIFAASTYAAGGDMSGGNKPAQNGATNDMESTSPNKALPKDSTQEHDRGYQQKSSRKKHKSSSGSSTYHRSKSGTDTGTEGPGSGSKNKD